MAFRGLPSPFSAEVKLGSCQKSLGCERNEFVNSEMVKSAVFEMLQGIYSQKLFSVRNVNI